MKKIDLHIHTKATKSDPDKFFNLSKLIEYVEKLNIDCIAITNHNLFDLDQFNIISNSLKILVLPGIEINFEKGHLLLISDCEELDDFNFKCNQVNAIIQKTEDSISVSRLKEIFGDLKRYLLIPHYDKKPAVSTAIIEELNEFISTGEVTSPKKFNYCIKDKHSLVPTIFSDLRFSDDLLEFSPRQTFIDSASITFKSIKTCLLDKGKVSLSEKGGQSFFQILENGQVISNGLNIILGERSSGKTVTLNKIEKQFENVKYIRQFELLEREEEKDIDQFNKHLSNRQSRASDSYLSEFKNVVNDVIKIDGKGINKEVETYIESLLTVATEEQKKDIFSQAVLFNESKFTETDSNTLKTLIQSVMLLIENEEYREIINTHISRGTLILLLLDLIKKYNEDQELHLKKLYLNSIITNIKNELHSSSASSTIKEIEFYNILIEKEKLRKFTSIVNSIKFERTIIKQDVRRFQIVANTREFTGAQELNNKCGKKAASFSNAFKNYRNPVDYLEALKDVQSLEEIDYYKYFIVIDYKILNEYGLEVSGGERSEFNLLEKIQDAYHFDILLIDEPESSFDNLFLRNEVNEQIKEISKSFPVVIVTHNNTVGASIKPDYILYTKKEIIKNKPYFKIYSGFPSDNLLRSIEGETISNYSIILNCLEAGDDAYKERGKSYEILKH